MEKKLNELTEAYFGDNSPEELTVEQILEYFSIFNAVKDEYITEAQSRIISKGTEKVTRSVGNASAKSRGMSNSRSAVDQVKRGARVVDDRVSGAVNSKLDDIINFTQEQKREKLITGKNTFKLGKALKTIISLIVGGNIAGGVASKAGAKVAGSVAGKGAVAKAAGALAGGSTKMVVGTAITIIGLMAARALSKRTEEREKKRILLELETELKITKEKIEDARGDNNKEQKYQLMRIQANLEKEITRIKHGLRYY